MATIRSRGNKYHVQIRKLGYPSLTRSFRSISVAKRWAKATEADMERSLHVSIPDPITVGELLRRYESEIVPNHKGCRVEIYKVKTLKKFFSSIPLSHLSSKEIAQYRDLRLKTISPVTVKRELTVLSSAISHASKMWGITVKRNPIADTHIPKFLMRAPDDWNMANKNALLMTLKWVESLPLH